MGKQECGWVFGLLEFEKDSQKCLELCEIYDLDKQGIGAASVDWKQFRRDKKMILGDLQEQSKCGIEFFFNSKTKKIHVRRRKPKMGKK